ncbi:LysR family transcriptional regulator [Actinoallomurus purpureus]|uniref:LysR family transcriptional regulator n=1 Tax=Actinoallomurus purpureus TaxID=478114 RepID=UPI002092DA01|nr:LysR family transcriptional regulator [Actinoallomurus purpureus]MCO6006228.1 LysR family transcriptional regulator [Actinoallomurus purpureus]
MAIDLRLMRYVVAVAEEGGFQRAADRLLIAQPPLSRQIRDLERELGVTLFERRPAVRLTEAGRIFVESARTILAESDRLVERTVLAGRGELGTVRVGYIFSAVFETLPRLVAAMGESHPGVTVDVRDGWTPELDAALLADGHDLVLSRDIPQRPEYRRETLRCERIVAVVDEGHALVRRGRVGLREFAGQRFCHPARRLAPDRYDFMAKALERTGETFEYWESPIHGLSHLDLQDRRSFALVAASVVGRVPVGTVTIALTDDVPPLELQMVWKRSNASAALRLLIDTARDVARREGWNDPV